MPTVLRPTPVCAFEGFVFDLLPPIPLCRGYAVERPPCSGNFREMGALTCTFVDARHMAFIVSPPRRAYFQSSNSR